MADNLVLVIGGTRSTGLHAAHALRRDGNRVRVLARSPAAALTGGRFVYMTSIGVTRQSLFVTGLNIWKGNTILWRRRAEDAIRSSGFDYTIVRAAFLLNRPPNQRAMQADAEAPAPGS